MGITLNSGMDRLSALIAKGPAVLEQDEPTIEVAAANPITVSSGADDDIMLEQRDDTLSETRVIWLDVRHAEALAAAILAQAKIVRGQR
jgi:hypothetical protein